jgi:hypothetical protein
MQLFVAAAPRLQAVAGLTVSAPAGVMAASTSYQQLRRRHARNGPQRTQLSTFFAVQMGILPSEATQNGSNLIFQVT